METVTSIKEVVKSLSRGLALYLEPLPGLVLQSHLPVASCVYKIWQVATMGGDHCGRQVKTGSTTDN